MVVTGWGVADGKAAKVSWPQAQGPDDDARVQGGYGVTGGRLVAAFGDRVAQAEPDAGELHGPAHVVTREGFPDDEKAPILL